MRSQKYILFLAVLSFLVLNSCTGEQIPANHTTALPEITQQILFTTTSPSELGTASMTPKPTEHSATSTPRPSATSTPTSTATSLPPSLTPLPVLPSEQANSLVWELLVNNAGCELPCYWGITPGETAWQNANQFFASFTDRIDQGPTKTYVINGANYSETGYQVNKTIPDYSDPVSSSYMVTNGIVEKIYVFPIATELRYQLHQVLMKFGMPDEVLAWLLEDTPSGKPWFQFFLFYKDRGITAVYDGPAQYDGNVLQVCPEAVGPKLILIPPRSKDVYGMDGMERDAYDAPFRIPSLNDLPGKSIESFYETMKVPGACLRFDPNDTE